MRKLTLVVVVLLALSLCSVAADTPKVEVYGGYSFLKMDTSVSGVNSLNTNGWTGSITGNFNRFLGVTAEMSGQYRTNQNLFSTGDGLKSRLHNFMFGPQVGYNSGKIRPFGHALFGLSHGSFTEQVSGVDQPGAISDNAFAMALGGGVDVKANRLVSIRLGQVDWVRTQFGLSSVGGADSQNHFRYSAGIVLNF